MTGPRFKITRRWNAHIWHVLDRYRLTIDVVAFRPTGGSITAAPLAIATITAEAAHPDAIAYLERRLARRVGLRLP